jgi:hypothetical protein
MRKIVPEEGRELIGSPIAGVVGDEIIYNVDMGSTVTIDSDSWIHAWKGTTNVSSSVLSGSMSSNGNIITLKKISNELAAEYRYTIKALVNGQHLVFWFRRRVERESGAK